VGKRRSTAKTAKKARNRGAAAKPARSQARAAASRTKRPKARTAKSRPRRPKKEAAARPDKSPRLNRERRILEEVVPTPPSSLNMDRHGTAARSGRAALESSRNQHAGMPELTGGDVDGDWENAYFSGEEAPGGDNPTPDQDIVDEIGKALGVEYQDNEELKASDKVVERDKHRWELDPASAEDYKDRD
jgi:uncharacterized protein DUF6335